jgi:redox-sensing transcriptional repressor
VQRLPLYLQCLDDLPAGQSSISSEELATEAGLNSAQVRKDLSFLGSYGVRGVGYDVDKLRFEIRQELGLNKERGMVIVGIGNLGRALANFRGFQEQGFQIVGLFDADPRKIGGRIDGHEIEPLDALGDAVRSRDAAIAVIATPAESAQEVADLLASAGICAILNFAPVVIRVPDAVDVRRVDFSSELRVLSFYLHQRSM